MLNTHFIMFVKRPQVLPFPLGSHWEGSNHHWPTTTLVQNRKQGSKVKYTANDDKINVLTPCEDTEPRQLGDHEVIWNRPDDGQEAATSSQVQSEIVPTHNIRPKQCCNKTQPEKQSHITTLQTCWYLRTFPDVHFPNAVSEAFPDASSQHGTATAFPPFVGILDKTLQMLRWKDLRMSSEPQA